MSSESMDTVVRVSWTIPRAHGVCVCGVGVGGGGVGLTREAATLRD